MEELANMVWPIIVSTIKFRLEHLQLLANIDLLWGLPHSQTLHAVYPVTFPRCQGLPVCYPIVLPTKTLSLSFNYPIIPLPCPVTPSYTKSQARVK